MQICLIRSYAHVFSHFIQILCSIPIPYLQYCGNGIDYCGGDCCQNGPCLNGPGPTPPSPTPPTTPTPPSPPTPPTSGFNYDANHGEDSRLIAYVGNWQTCPTIEQTDAYSHMVIAFAVSYTWASGKNNCDAQCNIAPTVPICNNGNNQALVDSWRAAGKKVILSFGPEYLKLTSDPVWLSFSNLLVLPDQNQNPTDPLHCSIFFVSGV